MGAKKIDFTGPPYHCPGCDTALHKRIGAWFDYLDSPNSEPHTHDRCRWEQEVRKRFAVQEHLVDVLRREAVLLAQVRALETERDMLEKHHREHVDIWGLLSETRESRDALEELATLRAQPAAANTGRSSR